MLSVILVLSVASLVCDTVVLPWEPLTLESEAVIKGFCDSQSSPALLESCKSFLVGMAGLEEGMIGSLGVSLSLGVTDINPVGAEVMRVDGSFEALEVEIVDVLDVVVLDAAGALTVLTGGVLESEEGVEIVG